MKSYIMAILGIVILGVMIEIIMPNGRINKFIKNVYAIFAVAVFISPITNFFSNKTGYHISYSNFEINDSFVEYFLEEQVKSTEIEIETVCNDYGFSNIDIKLNFSIKNYEIQYNLCNVNLKNLVISSSGQHINKYEFIRQAVGEKTGLGDAEIIFDE